MNTSNILGFEETEKMGLRKGVVFYFNDWIDEKIISVLEEIIEQFSFPDAGAIYKEIQWRKQCLCQSEKYSWRMEKDFSSGI